MFRSESVFRDFRPVELRLDGVGKTTVVLSVLRATCCRRHHLTGLTPPTMYIVDGDVKPVNVSGDSICSIRVHQQAFNTHYLLRVTPRFPNDIGQKQGREKSNEKRAPACRRPHRSIYTAHALSYTTKGTTDICRHHHAKREN